MRDALAEVKDDFDICLIDCPPHIQLHGWSALVAADAAVIPGEPEAPAVFGLSEMMGWIDQARDTVNPKLKMVGVILTKYEGVKYADHRNYERTMTIEYGDGMFKSRFAVSAFFKTCWTVRQTVVEWPRSANSAAAELMMTMAAELVSRVEAQCGPIHQSPTSLSRLEVAS